MPERPRIPRGLLDTSVVIDLERIADEKLPVVSSVSTITMAELAAGPHATDDSAERARRQERLQDTEARIEAYPFDEAAARSFGSLYAALARAQGLPLFTRNAEDFAGLEDLVDVISVT